VKPAAPLSVSVALLAVVVLRLIVDELFVFQMRSPKIKLLLALNVSEAGATVVNSASSVVTGMPEGLQLPAVLNEVLAENVFVAVLAMLAARKTDISASKKRFMTAAG
jgi:hypothetical protein